MAFALIRDVSRPILYYGWSTYPLPKETGLIKGNQWMFISP